MDSTLKTKFDALCSQFGMERLVDRVHVYEHR